MTKQQALYEMDLSCRKNLGDALGELDGSGIIYFISEVKRTLTTQLLYALQGRLKIGDDITVPFETLRQLCKENGIREPSRDIITKTLQSNHFSGKAIDIVPVIGSAIQWTYTDANKNLFQSIAEIMKRNGFRWGGDWEGWKDYPHYEM